MGGLWSVGPAQLGEWVAQKWNQLAGRFGPDVLQAVVQGVDGNAVRMREVLEDFEKLVTNVQVWRGGSGPTKWLDTDGKLKPVLNRILFMNFEQSEKIFQNLNRQAFLKDLANISDLPNFVPTLRQLKKPDVAVKGVVAETQEAAKDLQTLGRFDPATNPRGLRDINVTVYRPDGKKVTDFDLVSGGAVWQLKVGPNGGWTPTQLDGWIENAVQYARQNGMSSVGFRLDAAALAKFNTASFQRVLAQKRVLYADIEFFVREIATPPIP